MTSPLKNAHTSDRKFNFLGLFHCSAETFPGCLFQKSLNASITGKLIGMLAVSIAGFLLLIVLNTLSLNKIDDHNQRILNISIPEYKVSQHILRTINGFKISLLQILNTDELKINDNNVLANQRRLNEIQRMILALQNGGPGFDLAKISSKPLDVFTVEAASSPVIRELLTEITIEYTLLNQANQKLVDFLLEPAQASDKDELIEDLIDSLNEMYELVIDMTVEINTQKNQQFKGLSNIIRTSRRHSLRTGLMIVFVLCIATLLHIMLIVIPLQNILKRVKTIARGEADLIHHVKVKTDDEVGQLAHQLNTFVDNIFSINSFKAVIEEEESTTDVNQRLAGLFLERYHVRKVFIYELTGSKDKMSIAYATDYEEVCSPEILDNCDFCRAKRTGHTISSLEFPNICKQFPHGDRMEHHCIPMIASGRVVGVVQFLYDRNNPAESRDLFEDRVKRASRYIKEATPVIEAKRFASVLHETSLKDPMTDLYNRRFLESYTQTLVACTLRRKGNVGILMCDMDFFKEVNDNYGHEVGDTVLVRTALVLKSCVRESDLIIRYGGEEFLVLLIDMKKRQKRQVLLDLAEKIRKTMESTVINIPGGTLQKTMSIGISEFPKDTKGFWEAIKFADVALYQAKQSGRNKVVAFTKDMWDESQY